MITVIITALNEELNLRKSALNVVSAAESAGVPYELVIVDDGSKDGTPQVIAQLVKENPVIRSITHKINQGIGASILEAARGAKYE